MRRGYQKIDFLFAKSALFHEYISACVCLFALPKVNFLLGGGGRGADLWGLLRASKWIVSKWNPLLLYACLIQRKGFAVKAYIQLVQSQERANKTKHEITIIPARKASSIHRAPYILYMFIGRTHSSPKCVFWANACWIRHTGATGEIDWIEYILDDVLRISNHINAFPVHRTQLQIAHRGEGCIFTDA